MVQYQHEPGNICEFKESKEIMFSIDNLVPDRHGTDSDEISSRESTKTAESFLTEMNPWWMADSKEDRLLRISRKFTKPWEVITHTWSPPCRSFGRRAVEEDMVKVGTTGLLGKDWPGEAVRSMGVYPLVLRILLNGLEPGTKVEGNDMFATEKTWKRTGMQKKEISKSEKTTNSRQLREPF
jgi:hypothetical protein